MVEPLDDKMVARLKRIDELFTLPDVIVKINELVRSPKTSASDIAKTISNDIALSGKVLKMVNSSFYGFSRRITNINYAIVILGFNAIRNLIMSIFLAGQRGKCVAGFDLLNFWKYSVACALATDHLAGVIGYPQRDDAFMAGLMNKIGIMLMNQYFPDDFAQVLTKSRAENILLLAAEKQLLDYDHYELGAALLDKWNLPPEIVEVCRHIANPQASDSPLCLIAHLANVLTRALCLGSPGDNVMPNLAPETLEKLGIKREQLAKIMEDLTAASPRALAFLNEV